MVHGILPWSVATGKAEDGIDISHSRNSSRTEASVSRSSMTFSMRGSHEVARWQFCRQTQSPVLIAFAISASAFGPCPCPREMIETSHSFSFANVNSIVVGSAPVDRMKTTGTVDDVSWKISVSRSGGTCFHIIGNLETMHD